MNGNSNYDPFASFDTTSSQSHSAMAAQGRSMMADAFTATSPARPTARQPAASTNPFDSAAARRSSFASGAEDPFAELSQPGHGSQHSAQVGAGTQPKDDPFAFVGHSLPLSQAKRGGGPRQRPAQQPTGPDRRMPPPPAYAPAPQASAGDGGGGGDDLAAFFGAAPAPAPTPAAAPKPSSGQWDAFGAGGDAAVAPAAQSVPAAVPAASEDDWMAAFGLSDAAPASAPAPAPVAVAAAAAAAGETASASGSAASGQFASGTSGGSAGAKPLARQPSARANLLTAAANLRDSGLVTDAQHKRIKTGVLTSDKDVRKALEAMLRTGDPSPVLLWAADDAPPPAAAAAAAAAPASARRVRSGETGSRVQMGGRLNSRDWREAENPAVARDYAPAPAPAPAAAPAHVVSRARVASDVHGDAGLVVGANPHPEPVVGNRTLAPGDSIFTFAGCLCGEMFVWWRSKRFFHKWKPAFMQLTPNRLEIFDSRGDWRVRHAPIKTVFLTAFTDSTTIDMDDKATREGASVWRVPIRQNTDDAVALTEWKFDPRFEYHDAVTIGFTEPNLAEAFKAQFDATVADKQDQKRASLESGGAYRDERGAVH